MDNYSLQKPLNMAPTGIATFAKSALATDIYHLNADVAVLGAPFDLAIQGRTGCRLGPRGIRLGSTRFTYKKGGTYDSERKQYYMDARRWHVVDCGDVDYIPGDLKGTMANLESAVSIIQKQGALPVVLGGDCAVDFPVLQGLEGIGNFDIVHIDAHLDWTKPLDGQKFFNGSPMRNAAGLPYVGRILHLGVRGIGSSGPDDFLKKPANMEIKSIPAAMSAAWALTRFSRNLGLPNSLSYVLISMRWMPFMRRLRVPHVRRFQITMKRSISLKPLARQATSKELS